MEVLQKDGVAWLTAEAIVFKKKKVNSSEEVEKESLKLCLNLTCLKKSLHLRYRSLNNILAAPDFVVYEHDVH